MTAPCFEAANPTSHRHSAGEKQLKERFQKIHGHTLDTSNPQSFSEKLYCRMIAVNRAGDRVMSKLSDKFRVRNYVERRIGGAHLAKLLWHGTDVQAVPFETLPEKYMIKANHGSAMNRLVRGEIDRASVVKEMARWMNSDFASQYGEHHYDAILRQIVIEEMLDDGQEDGPLDYRFWCFDGKIETIQVDNNSHSINPFYDSDWKRIPGGYRPKAREVEIDRPANFEEMKVLASRLSRGIDFVRVDLYSLKERVVFGELTFTPTAGVAIFKPSSWETRLGDAWRFDDRPLEFRESFRS
jgi:hypothetical protein